METEETGEDVVRRQSFTVEGPVDLDLGTGSGRVTVRLVDEPGVHVEVRHDPEAASPWAQGMSSLMNWVSNQFGSGGGQFGSGGGQFGDVTSSSSMSAEAVRQTRVDFTAGRLVVRTPKELQLRSLPVAVTVQAPIGSHVEAKSGSGDVTITGAAGRVDLTTGSGRINADQAESAAKVETGSGTVRLGPMVAGLRAKSGSGDIEVTAVGAQSTVVTGSGDVWLGAVTSDVLIRTGSGRATIANAASGELELHTGSGAIQVGVRKGSPAEIDLSSGSGEARSELDLSARPPESAPALRVRGRTGSGSVVVSAAVE